MATAELLDVTTLAPNFPEDLESTLSRENLLETIEVILERGTSIVVLEGEEGIGKTTLLGNLCARNPRNSIAVFIRGASKIGYSPGYVRFALAEQLSALSGTELALEADQVSDAFLQAAYYRIGRARRRDKPVYVVVDGLAEIPPEEHRTATDSILDLLPINLTGFKLIVSGNEATLPPRLARTPSVKPYTVASFSLEETHAYLNDVSTSPSHIQQLHHLCRGIPGRLAIVRRLISSGSLIEDILGADPKDLPEFIRAEWSLIPKSELHQRLLATLAFGLQDFSPLELSGLLRVDQNEIVTAVGEVPFLRAAHPTRVIEFLSDAHRRYAAEQLSYLRSSVLDQLIEHARANSESSKGQQALTGYLATAGRHAEVVTMLTPAFLAHVLKDEWSIGPVAKHIELGMKIANGDKWYSAALQFSVQRSYLAAFSRIDILRAEMETYLALDEFPEANALAAICVLKEDRLHLLAQIAKAREQKKLEKDTGIAEQIKVICAQIDVPALGERAVEIAADLVYSEPSIALDLVEKAAGTIGEGIDVALTTIALNAMARRINDDETQEAVQAIRKKIKDPDLKEFSDTFSVFFHDLSAADVIRKVEALDVGRRMFLLRHWVLSNRERNDAAEVVSYSLGLLVSQTGYTLTMRDLREIATPLPYLSNGFECRDIVQRIDALKASVGGLGTTEDYTRLELLLARTQARYEPEAAKSRAIELYYKLAAHDQLATKTACLAWLFGSLPDIDVDGALDAREKLTTVINDELDDCLSQLLSSSADHFEVAKRTLAAFVRRDMARAETLCQRLNTEARRDEARSFLVTEALEQKSAFHSQLSLIIRIALGISHPRRRARILERIARRLSETTYEDIPWSGEIVSMLHRSVSDIVFAAHRTTALAYLYVTFCANPDTRSSMAPLVRDELIEAWDRVDGGGRKVVAGLKVATIMGKTDEVLARAFVVRAKEHRATLVFDSTDLQREYYLLLELTGRAMEGLIRGRDRLEVVTRRYQGLVEKLASVSSRAGLWATLALRAFGSGHEDYGRSIVETYLRPLLHLVAESDSGLYQEILVDVSPALYKAHSLTGLQAITQLDPWYRDVAVSSICNFLMFRVATGEPHKRHVGDRLAAQTYEEFVDIIHVLAESLEDAGIYSVIHDLADGITHKDVRNRLNRQQRATIQNQLQDIVRKRLPDSRNIQHEGFAIICEAQLGRMFGLNVPQWEALFDRARLIPNLADQAYVLTILTTSRHWKRPGEYEEAVDEAFSVIDRIPVAADRADHYKTAADYLSYPLPGKAKLALQRAFSISTYLEFTNDSQDFQTRVLDLAHTIDPKFADALAEAIDDDPARVSFKRNSRERVKLLGLKQAIAEQPKVEELSPMSVDNVAQAAWLNLSNLNAGSLGVRKEPEFLPFLAMAAGEKLGDVFPIYAWALSNSARRYTHRSDTDSCNQLVNSLLDAADFAARIASEACHRPTPPIEWPTDTTAPQKTFAEGQRTDALLFIRDWIGNTAPGELIFCDPYFSLADLELLRIVKEISPNTAVTVLGDRQHLKKDQGFLTDDALLSYWRLRISELDPPQTSLILLQTQERPFPIHDRWLLSERTGLHLGTSFGSFGRERIAQMSALTADEVKETREKLRPFLSLERKEHMGTRLRYAVINL